MLVLKGNDNINFKKRSAWNNTVIPNTIAALRVERAAARLEARTMSSVAADRPASQTGGRACDTPPAGFAQRDMLEKQIKPVTTPNAQRMLQMLPLWEELAKVAAPTFARFGGTEAGVLNQSILGSLQEP